MRTHAFTLVLSYIYGLVALLDNIQSSFSSITISTYIMIPSLGGPPVGLGAAVAYLRRFLYHQQGLKKSSICKS